MRQSWDQTWLNVAQVISSRSKCVNRRVGAVIVNEKNRIIATGYNGSPRDYKPMKDIPVCAGACPRGGSSDRGVDYDNCISIHAEANALLFTDRSLVEGGTIYVTSPPCFGCAKLISNSGIARVVAKISEWDSHTPNDQVISFLKNCSINIEILTEE